MVTEHASEANSIIAQQPIITILHAYCNAPFMLALNVFSRSIKIICGLDYTYEAIPLSTISQTLLI